MQRPVHAGSKLSFGMVEQTMYLLRKIHIYSHLCGEYVLQQLYNGISSQAGQFYTLNVSVFIMALHKVYVLLFALRRYGRLHPSAIAPRFGVYSGMWS